MIISQFNPNSSDISISRSGIWKQRNTEDKKHSTYPKNNQDP